METSTVVSMASDPDAPRESFTDATDDDLQRIRVNLKLALEMVRTEQYRRSMGRIPWRR